MSRLARIHTRLVTEERGYDTPCLIYTGYLSPTGYGQIGIGSRTNGTRRTAYVHRIVWEARRGPIPRDLQIDHLCRQRACCEVTHLEVVSHRTNTLRGVGATAVNARKTHCANGHSLTPPNGYVDIRGRRVCRECRNERVRRCDRMI